MALAFLQYEDSNHSHCRFRIDLGITNRFYTYAIGNDQMLRRHGLSLFAQPQFVSPLLSVPEHMLGRSVLEIPKQQFDRHHRYVQLISFRTPNKTGPAISDIVSVPVFFNSEPTLSIPFSASSHETTVMAIQPYSVPFAYEEYSEGKSFFGKLIKGATKAVSGLVKGVAKAVPAVSKLAGSLLPQLLPALTPILGKTGASLVGQLAGVLGSGKSLTDVLKDPSKVAQIGKILQQSGMSSSGMSPSGMAPMMAPVQAMSLAAATTPSATASSFSYGDDHFLRRQYGGSLPMRSSGAAPSFTESSAWPAWEDPDRPVDHQALVVKLLRHSLHPETVQGLISDPMHHGILRGLITHGLIDTFKVIPGFHEALERAVTADQRQGHAPTLAVLPSHSPEHHYHRVEGVTLHFSDIEPQQVGERSRVLYHMGDGIGLPLELDTPRPIRQGTLQILVKCPKTLKVYLEKTIHLGHLNSGDLPKVPRLSRAQVRSLQPNAEYLICAVLTWTARSSHSGQERQLGTSTSVLATLVGDYVFDHLGSVEDVFSLNDPEEHRPYWHKIWEGDFSEDSQTIELDCKYYYVLKPREPKHARMETMIRMDHQGGADQSGKLQTGLVLSAVQLERLTAWVSNKPRLTKDEIIALDCHEFYDDFHQLARTHVVLEGDRGDSITLWVYPEVELREVLLQQVIDSDANGHVLALSDQTVYFPIPSAAHFVGTRS